MKARPQCAADEFKLTPPVQPRHDYSYVVGVIYREYRKVTGLRCPWDAACGQQLKAALRRLRHWPSERIEQAITNKFASDENQCLSAKVWLPRLEDYAAARLDMLRRQCEEWQPARIAGMLPKKLFTVKRLWKTFLGHRRYMCVWGPVVHFHSEIIPPALQNNSAFTAK